MIRFRKMLLVLLCVVISASLLRGSGDSPRYLRRPLRTDNDNQTIAQPKEREVSDMYAILYNTWIRHLNIESKLAKKPTALNVNAWDEVPNSSWFTNRMGLGSISFEEIVNGLEGQSPTPAPWRVDRRNDS